MIKSFLYFLWLPIKADRPTYMKKIFVVIMLGIYPGVFASILGRFTEAIINNSSNAVYYIAAIGMLLIAKSSLSCVDTFCTERLKDNVGKRQNQLLTAKMGKIGIAEFENEETYELLCRIGNNLDEEFFRRTSVCLYSLEIVLNYYSLVFFLFSIDIVLAIIIALLFIPLAVVGYRCGYEKYLTKKETVEIKRKADYLEKMLTEKEFLDERYLFGFSKKYIDKWYSQYKYYKKKEAKTKFANTANMEKIGLFSNGIFLGMIVYLAIYGIYSSNIAPCVAMASQATVFSGSIRWGVMDLFQSMIDNKLYLEDWKKVFSLQEIEYDEKMNKCKKISTIEFNKVTFSYPNTDCLILNNFSARFEKGNKYVIVGENGAGKSTIVKLLLGFYDSYEGEIKIDGKEIREYSKSDLFDFFGVVFQDSVCFPISIKQNITADTNEDITEDDLLLSGLQSAIDLLPQKENTVVGYMRQGSKVFSGGEKKRICIARALHRRSSVYILDEPTSSIDPIYEDEINTILLDNFSADISIIISHRLGIATRADKILVLKDGKVAECGTHIELITKNSLYADMFRKQKEQYEDKI